jgi:hypothetical protein
MLKVIGTESVKAYYLAQRLVLLFTRLRGIPKYEPEGISYSAKRDQFNYALNDVEAYQDGKNVKFISLCRRFLY